MKTVYEIVKVRMDSYWDAILSGQPPPSDSGSGITYGQVLKSARRTGLDHESCREDSRR